MGTVQIPEQNPKGAKSQLAESREDKSGVEIVDIPRIGPLMWFLLGALLIPPAVVTIMGNVMGPIPNQKLWIILLGLPFPLLLVTMPRRYLIANSELLISGLFYKIRIPASSIISIEPIGRMKALLAPGSIFCSDPARALMVKRKGKMALIISPRKKEPFLALKGSE